MRPIDADKAKDNIKEWLDCVGTALIGKGLSYTWELEGCIDEAPTLTLDDIVPHGRWEANPRAYGFDVCSACHDCNIWGEWSDGKKWNYCPNCGAKMDLEEI